MAGPQFDALAPKYRAMWRAMTVSPAVAKRADATARIIFSHLPEYQAVEKATGVPWHFVGAIHYRESDLNFNTHLANGDSLKCRTQHVPRGLIIGKSPPYTWSEAAIAAIHHQGLDHVKFDSFARYCYEMEAYNGWGYRAHGVTSPYLWQGSNQHLRGKYVADGVYSQTAIDEQMGGIVILKSLMEIPHAPGIAFPDIGETTQTTGFFSKLANLVKGK